MTIFSFHLLFLFLFLFFLSGRPTTLFEAMGKADMWLIQTCWDFEFPPRLLPNFEFVGGLHCKPAKPLPKITYSCFALFTLHFLYFECLITVSQMW